MFDVKKIDSVNNPNSVHGIYPYRGKISSIDARHIISQMPVGSVLLDPFCGSGTIVYEGLSHGLTAYGVDANPIAVLLSKGKIHMPNTLSEAIAEANSYISQIDNVVCDKVIPEYTTSYFHHNTLNQIAKLSCFFEEMSPYLRACFVGAIALSARGCNDYKWTSSTVGKNINPKRDIDFFEKFISKIKKHYFPVLGTSEIFYADSRKISELIPENSIDFVYTSPPYFDCLDYTAYYARFVYEILGYDRIAVRDTLIQDFTNYKDNMQTVLNELYKVLKPNGNVIFVVGDKKARGKVINGGEFFNAISPFQHVKTIERVYSGTSSKVFDEINKTERKEQVIIWKK